MALETNMQTRDHVRTAREFLTAADREFEAGDHLQASEKLWGAASHALIAVAQQRNLPHGSHRALKKAAQLLVDETGDHGAARGVRWRRRSFAQTSITTLWKTFELDADRPTVKEFVDRLMALSA